MSLVRRRFSFLVVASVLVMLSGHGAWSQTARTIRIVVPYPPGGVTDVLARLLAEQIGQAQGPAIVVENRAGASSVIGTEVVSRAAPDGNTLLINATAFVINPHLQKVNYDPLTSFEPICQLVNLPMVIAVNAAASSYRTLGDLLGAARDKPGTLTLASVGPGTVSHVAFERLKRLAKVDMTFVPYSGNAPAMNALLGAHVTAAFADYAVLAEQIKAGKLRALATAAPTRIEWLPDVPTVSESGYKDFTADYWLGLFAPAKTPKEMVAQLASRFTAAMQVLVAKGTLTTLGLFPVGTCGSSFGAFLRKQYDEYGRAIRESGIKAE